MRADMDGLPMGTAAYRVLGDIEKNYNKLGAMKKELYDAGMLLNTVKEFLARQNDVAVIW
jgi:hypothetical protein